MRTHTGSSGRIDLGQLSEPTQRRLENVDANWLEFFRNPARLVVQHVQPSEQPALPNVAAELLTYLSKLADEERLRMPGGEIFCPEEDGGQIVRFKVSSGGILAVAWAQPDYSKARWTRYSGQKLALVFEPYQRLNGSVEFAGSAEAGSRFQKLIDNFTGLYPPGDLQVREADGHTHLSLRDVNASVLAVIDLIRAEADPASTEGTIDVSSFRPGDVEDYCRFELRGAETWVLRPSLWSDPARAADAGVVAFENAA